MAEDSVSAAETPSERKARLIEEIKERAYELISGDTEVTAHSMVGDPAVFQDEVDSITVCAFVYVAD